MKNNFGISSIRRIGDYTVATIDTNQATFQGYKWHDLGAFGKRKFENLVVISRASEQTKVIYA